MNITKLIWMEVTNENLRCFTGLRCIYNYVDINECDASNGGCEQRCNNTIGSFYCSCDIGYQLDSNGYDCNGAHVADLQVQYIHKVSESWLNLISTLLIDVDECESNTAMCHPLANCSNIPGSYNCTCNPGYPGDGFINCTGM